MKQTEITFWPTQYIRIFSFDFLNIDVIFILGHLNLFSMFKSYYLYINFIFLKFTVTVIVTSLSSISDVIFYHLCSVFMLN